MNQYKKINMMADLSTDIYIIISNINGLNTRSKRLNIRMELKITCFFTMINIEYKIL